VLAWVFVSPLSGEQDLLLWPDDPALSSRDGMGREVHKRGKDMIMGVESPHLKVFPPPLSHEPTAAILHVPGGGYKRVVSGIHMPIADWFREQGIRPFMLVYRCPVDRSSPEPAMQDIQRAIRMLRANAREWNIDPDRIGVIGSSAGGNLAVRASVFSETNSYRAKDPMDRLSTKPDFSVLLYPAWVGSRSTGDLNDWVEVRSDFGPTFITAARDDKHFGSSPPYERALRSKRVPVEALFFEEGGHGFSLREPEETATWPEACLEFLRANRILP
jgi:acetyl esterase/lipase